METGVFQIDLKDGRIFRIFYANSTQKKKIIARTFEITDKIKAFNVITNGIHTVKQFEEHLKTI